MDLFPPAGLIEMEQKTLVCSKCRGNRPPYDHQEARLLAETDKLLGMCSGGAKAQRVLQEITVI